MFAFSITNDDDYYLNNITTQQEYEEKYLNEINRYSDLDLRTALTTDLRNLSPDQFYSKDYRFKVMNVINRLFYQEDGFVGKRFMNKFSIQKKISSGGTSETFAVGNGLILKSSVKSNREYRHEAFVGNLLNNLRDQHVYNFMYSYGVFECGPSIGMKFDSDPNYTFCDLNINNKFLLLEKINGKKYKPEEFTSEENFSIILQLILATFTAFELYKYSHNDLRSDNILIKKTHLEKVRYKINGQYYYVKTSGLIPVILDYGRTYIQYDGVDFGPPTDNLLQVNYFEEILNIYIYKPNLLKDLISISTYFYHNRDIKDNIFLKCLFNLSNYDNINEGIKDIDQYLYSIWNTEAKINIDMTFNDMLGYLNLLNKNINLKDSSSFYIPNESIKQLKMSKHFTIYDYLDEFYTIWDLDLGYKLMLDSVYSSYENLYYMFHDSFPMEKFINEIFKIPELKSSIQEKKYLYNTLIGIRRLKEIQKYSIYINPKLTILNRTIDSCIYYAKEMIKNIKITDSTRSLIDSIYDL